MDKLDIQNLVKGYSIETTVRESERIERFSDIIPIGTRLYIVHVPGSVLQDAVELASRLRAEGMEPVPHIVARRIESMAILDGFLGRLAGDAGVKQVLIVGGDVAPPVGEIDSSLQVLDSGLLEKYGIRTIGVAGHPEGHPSLKDAVLRSTLRSKNEYARKTGASVYIVTQFVFAPEPIMTWEQSYAADIGALPVTAGLPGLASAKTLLKFALDCGVGASLQAFTKRAGRLSRLLTVSTPDHIIVGLSRHRARHPQSHVTGVHFFPFGGFKRTAEWANAIVAGDFEMIEDDGLRVAIPAAR